MRSAQAGNYVREETLAAFVRLVSHTPELQAYTTSRLYSALRSDVSQESLTLAAVWIIGEFGDMLIQTGLVEEEEAKPVRTFPALKFHQRILSNYKHIGIRRRACRSSRVCASFALLEHAHSSIRSYLAYEALHSSARYGCDARACFGDS